MTNVNFDPDRFPVFIETAVHFRDEAKKALEAACRNTGKVIEKELEDGPGGWIPESYSVDYLESEGNWAFIRVSVTVSQTTKFRFFQTKRVFRQQF